MMADIENVSGVGCRRPEKSARNAVACRTGVGTGSFMSMLLFMTLCCNEYYLEEHILQCSAAIYTESKNSLPTVCNYKWPHFTPAPTTG